MSKLESYSSFLVLSTKQSFEQKRATDMKQAHMTVAKKTVPTKSQLYESVLLRMSLGRLGWYAHWFYQQVLVTNLAI